MTVIALRGALAQNAAKGMGDDQDDERVDLAFDVVERALDEYQHLLTPELRQILRAVLVSELLDTPEGQEELRSVMSDPVVEASESVAKDATNPEGAKADKEKTGTR